MVGPSVKACLDLSNPRITGLGVVLHPANSRAFCKGWPRCEQPPGSLGWAYCFSQRTAGPSVKAGLDVCKPQDHLVGHHVPASERLGLL